MIHEHATDKQTDIQRLHLYRAIFAESTEAIAVIGLDGTYLEQNQSHRELLGFEDDDLEGQTPAIHLGAEKFEEVAQGLFRDGRWRGEVEARRKDGTKRLLDLSAFTVYEEDGRRSCYVGIKSDITDRKRHEQEIRALNADLEARVQDRTAKLEAANKELEGFTYSVSHDLRGPLRAIGATSMMLSEDYSDKLGEEGLHLLERQAQAAGKMAALIDDLLKLSRIGRQELQPQEVDLSALARQTMESLQEESEAGAEFLVAPDLKGWADPKLIQFVLQNLIGNSLKFAKKGEPARIEFGRTRANGVEAYYVRDNGIGFDPQYAEKILLPFERLVRDDEYPGTGIGLANVKRIVERHGGCLWAESEGNGRGATFFFTLPSPPLPSSSEPR